MECQTRMKRAAAILIACFMIVYILPLGIRPMIIPDESRYAEIPREMIESGDWVSPKLAGVRYFEKPVLGYWLNASSMSVFGQNKFASRLPAAVAAGLSALLVFLIVRRKDSRTGILAAGILLTSIMFFAIGVFNVLDGPFTLCITGTMVFFFLAYTETSARRKMALLALCGVFSGLSFLTKGFLALVLPVIIIIPFLAWEKRWKEYLVMPLIPALTALLVALPWCVLIALRESDFWNYFFWIEHVARFIKPGGPQHPEPFWFFVPVIIGGAMPWTTMLPAAAAGLRKLGFKAPLLRYCICWLVFPFIFFSASGGKLGTYILPCFPPLAVLMAIGLESYFHSGGRKLFSVAATLTAAATAILLAVLIVTETTGVLDFKLYEPDETAKWAPAAVGLVAWAILAGLAVRTINWRYKLALFCVAPMMFFTATHAAMSREMEKQKAPENFLTANAAFVAHDSILISDDYIGPAVCWLFQRSQILLLGEGGELKYGLKYEDTGKRLLSLKTLNELVAAPDKHAGRDVVLIVDYGRFSKFRNAIPRPDIERISNGFVLLRYNK